VAVRLIRVIGRVLRVSVAVRLSRVIGRLTKSVGLLG
jgi:hypothetical protein